MQEYKVGKERNCLQFETYKIPKEVKLDLC